MSVQMLVGTPAYNKAPVPAKTPSEKLYPITMMIEGEQPVWISVPQPDKLHLTIRLRPEHFTEWYKPEDPQDYGRMIMHALAMGQAGKASHNKYIPTAKISTAVQVNLANLGSTVYFTLSRTKGDPDGLHTLGIQLNPRSLNQVGAYDFLDLLHQVTGQRLLVGRMLADAKISRLDVAVDVVGVQIADMLVSVSDAGTECIWRATSGDFESIAFFRKKKKKSGALELGERTVIVYDKRAERIAAGAPAPYGPAPVTRLETSKKRFGNKPFWLTDLPAAPNPLKSVRAGLLRSAQTPITRRFIQYAALRRAYSQSRTSQTLSISNADSQILEACWLSHPSDLIDGDAVWAGWHVGLHQTGASLLIEAAMKKSASVPTPDIGELLC